MASYNNFKNGFLRGAAFAFCVFTGLAASSSFSWSAPVASSEKQTNDCLMKFYQSKDKACINDFIKKISGAAETDNKNGGVSSWAVGFFAKLFQSDPQAKAEVLKQEATADTKILFSAALYAAGLKDEAKTYARAQGIPNALRDMEEHGLSSLEQVKPANPGENDFLIGAYTASGDVEYIKRILENFKGASDDMARDSLRLSMMMGRFGPALTVPDRHPATMRTVCEKYHCKQNSKDLMRFMTLSSAFWAVKSVSASDSVVKKIFSDFFDQDSRLKEILAEENISFANYVTSLTAYSAIKDNENINSSLSIYEELGSGADAAKAMIKK